MNSFEVVSTGDARAVMVQVLHWIATIIEVVGVGAIVIAAVASTIVFVKAGVRSGWKGRDAELSG